MTGGARASAAGGAAFTALLAPGDFSGDGKPDLLARDPDGRLLMYRGDGAGGWSGTPQTVGSGWAPFTALLAPGDFTGDGKPDVLARNGDGTLLLYRGDGDGGWVTGKAETIGSGWGPFKAVLAAGDFCGDGKADVFARHHRGRAAALPRQRRRRVGDRHGRARRQRLGRLHRARRGRRLQRRRQGRRARPHVRRQPLPLPRQRRERLARPAGVKIGSGWGRSAT